LGIISKIECKKTKNSETGRRRRRRRRRRRFLVPRPGATLSHLVKLMQTQNTRKQTQNAMSVNISNSYFIMPKAT
jgi:hypothetical protein